jgi:transposase
MLNHATAQIFVCLDSVDMRKSFDMLAQVVRDHFGHDPLSGAWFIFRGKSRDRLKILYWDRDGYAICQKRLEAGTFQGGPGNRQITHPAKTMGARRPLPHQPFLHQGARQMAHPGD